MRDGERKGQVVPGLTWPGTNGERLPLLATAEASIGMITILGWVLSYTALQRLAERHGYLGWEAGLWPLTVDLLVFVATAIAMITARHSRGPTREAWALAVLAALVTVAGNMLSAGQDPVARALHAWPACCMVAAWHLFFRLVSSAPAERLSRSTANASERSASARRSRLHLVSPAPREPAPGGSASGVGDAVLAAAAERVRRGGESLTGERLARACGELGHRVSGRHAQRLLRRLEAGTKGPVRSIPAGPDPGRAPYPASLMAEADPEGR